MKVYEGFPDGTVLVHFNGSSVPLKPRLDLANHSPDGFTWGYRGSGPSQLALAILADAFPDDEPFALEFYQFFKEAVIARLAMDKGWSFDFDYVHLTAARIADAVKEMDKSQTS